MQQYSHANGINVTDNESLNDSGQYIGAVGLNLLNFSEAYDFGDPAITVDQPWRDSATYPGWKEGIPNRDVFIFVGGSGGPPLHNIYNSVAYTVELKVRHRSAEVSMYPGVTELLSYVLTITEGGKIVSEYLKTSSALDDEIYSYLIGLQPGLGSTLSKFPTGGDVIRFEIKSGQKAVLEMSGGGFWKDVKKYAPIVYGFSMKVVGAKLYCS